jgi:O-antigen ligase
MLPLPSTAIVFLIALPWLNPFAPGPLTMAMPLLFSWVCAAGALLMVAMGGRQPGAALHQPPLIGLAAGAWLIAALISVELGLLQYFGLAQALGEWVSPTELGIAFGNLRQRNQFASLTSIGLVALLWCAVQSWAHKATAPVLAAALLLGAGNAASSSRTGLMQLALVVALSGLWGAWRAPQVRRVLLVAVLAYAVALVSLPWLAGLDPSSSGAWARLRAGDLACASRLTLWGNVLDLIAQKPWGGWGWGELDYAHFVTLYPQARFCDILDNAHNLPLHLAVEFGVPVAGLLCGGALWAAWRARPWREADSSRQLAWGVLAVIVLHSLLEYPLWYGPFQVAAGLSVWHLWRTRASAGRPVLKRDVQSNWPLGHLFIGSGAIIFLMAAAFITWDYHRISQLYLQPAQRSPVYRDNTLEKIRDTPLFQNQLRFAELTTTALTPANAADVYAQAQALLHFSPEPRVIEKLIESAELLGLHNEAVFYQARYRAAFPDKYAQWLRDSASR